MSVLSTLGGGLSATFRGLTNAVEAASPVINGAGLAFIVTLVGSNVIPDVEFGGDYLGPIVAVVGALALLAMGRAYDPKDMNAKDFFVVGSGIATTALMGYTGAADLSVFLPG